MLKCCGDRGDRRGVAPFGGEAGGVDLEHRAKLEQVPEVRAVVQQLAVDAQRRLRAGLDDEDPGPLLGAHDPFASEPRDRFAHDGAADAEAARELRLRGQALPRLDAAGHDLGSDLPGDLRREMRRAPDPPDLHSRFMRGRGLRFARLRGSARSHHRTDVPRFGRGSAGACVLERAASMRPVPR